MEPSRTLSLISATLVVFPIWICIVLRHVVIARSLQPDHLSNSSFSSHVAKPQSLTDVERGILSGSLALKVNATSMGLKPNQMGDHKATWKRSFGKNNQNVKNNHREKRSFDFNYDKQPVAVNFGIPIAQEEAARLGIPELEEEDARDGDEYQPINSFEEEAEKASSDVYVTKSVMEGPTTANDEEMLGRIDDLNVERQRETDVTEVANEDGVTTSLVTLQKVLQERKLNKGNSKNGGGKGANISKAVKAKPNSNIKGKGKETNGTDVEFVPGLDEFDYDEDFMDALRKPRLENIFAQEGLPVPQVLENGALKIPDAVYQNAMVVGAPVEEGEKTYTCEDKNDDCSGHGNVCDLGVYRLLMAKRCPRTCNLCEQAEMLKVTCRDERQDCEKHKDVCLHKTYRKMMSQTCSKTCDLC